MNNKNTSVGCGVYLVRWYEWYSSVPKRYLSLHHHQSVPLLQDEIETWFCFQHILTKLSKCCRSYWDLSDQAVFFSSLFIDQYYSACVQCVLHFLFFPNKSENRGGLLLLVCFCIKIQDSKYYKCKRLSWPPNISNQSTHSALSLDDGFFAK